MLKIQKGYEMIQMLNGIIIKRFLFGILGLLYFYSCQNRENVKYKFKSEETYKILINETENLKFEWYSNGFVKSITRINDLGLNNGIQLKYYPNGILMEKSEWKNGKIEGELRMFNDLGEKIKFYTYFNNEKHGNMYEFYKEANTITHRLFKNDELIYIAIYQNNIKQFNTPVPIFRNETVENDSIYEVQIEFPFRFKGKLEIFLKDTIDFRKEYLDNYNLKLTISNFDKSWTKYDILLEYEPAEGDTLIWTEQVYSRTIEIN